MSIILVIDRKERNKLILLGLYETCWILEKGDNKNYMFDDCIDFYRFVASTYPNDMPEE